MIQTVKHEKIWGYEIWLHSPVPGKETSFVGGEKNEGGPLIKIIKANRPLSVQVHPDDKLAKELENENNGKSESWYVLESEPKSTLVMGLKKYDSNLIKNKLADETFEELLNKIPAHKGEFFNIPAGLVHGIGSGLTIFEVQQPSDTTYRYYDYNRLENGKPRELHVDKAIKSQKDLSWVLKPINSDPLSFTNKVGTQRFFTKPTILQETSVVIDLSNFESYICEKDEKINFSNYAVVSI